jgi:hypothetical protein
MQTYGTYLQRPNVLCQMYKRTHSSISYISYVQPTVAKVTVSSIRRPSENKVYEQVDAVLQTVLQIRIRKDGYNFSRIRIRDPFPGA